MWLTCIHSWGIRVCLLSFDWIASIILKLWNNRRTLSKMVFKTEYLANLLWLVWYDYMRMWEWLIGVEHDVYHRVIYFFLYLNYDKLYEVVDLWWCCWFLICKFDDDSCGACMYERCLFWWWIMLLNYYMQTMVLLMVNAYLQKWRWFRIFISNGVIWILCIQCLRIYIYIYIQWWWCWWVLVEHVHSVSYFHASWVLGYLYPVEWFEYFVFNGYMMFLLHHEAKTCCWWWYCPCRSRV